MCKYMFDYIARTQLWKAISKPIKRRFSSCLRMIFSKLNRWRLQWYLPTKKLFIWKHFTKKHWNKFTSFTHAYFSRKNIFCRQFIVAYRIRLVLLKKKCFRFNTKMNVFFYPNSNRLSFSHSNTFSINYFLTLFFILFKSTRNVIQLIYEFRYKKINEKYK